MRTSFLARFQEVVSAVLSGWDRLVFRGHLLALMRPLGMESYLSHTGVKPFVFGSHVQEISRKVVRAAEEQAKDAGRPIEYLDSSKIDKEARVQRIASEGGDTEGLLCTFKIVEPCMSFEYHRAKDVKERGLKLRERKCLHLYRYFRHPELGLIGTRLQTWFPFNIQVWLNGREWLSVAMRAQGIDFHRDDNCFTWIADPAGAQALMDQQLQRDWETTLASLLPQIHPLHEQIFHAWPQQYYWSIYQSEFATDYLFTTPENLSTLFPRLCRHAIGSFSSDDVMRFLSGKPVHHRYEGEVVSSCRRRYEGVRVKHSAHGNSIKTYDKARSVLRVETTINNTRSFRSFRSAANDPSGTPSWKGMRKGIADSYRRAQVSQASNERYAAGLAGVADTQRVAEIFDKVAQPVIGPTRRTRAIRIGDASDIDLLQTIARGEFAITGFRNADLRRHLFPKTSPELSRKQSARVSRLLRILRDHKIIVPLPKTRRYVLTDTGRLLTTAVFATRQASLDELTRAAA